MDELIKAVMGQTDIYAKAMRQNVSISFSWENEYGFPVLHVGFTRWNRQRIVRAFKKTDMMSMMEPEVMIRYVLKEMYEKLLEEPYDG